MANNSLDERQVRRQEVIFEIIHTEADYIKDLRVLVDIFVQPMRFLKVATPEQCDLMFGNIEEILVLHESINAAFMERQRREYPVVSDIADELLPFVSQFKIYAKYICNQDNALRLVEELKKESAHFMVFWKERQGRPECRNLPMESFMVLPFQRLLKYPLLLQTLLASSDDWSQEYANGKMVVEQIDAWIKKIQDTQTKLDSYACLDALSKSIRDIDWTPYLSGEHRLVYSGPVKTSMPQLDNGQPDLLSKEEPGVMWLFDSFLVIAKPSSPGWAAGTGPTHKIAGCPAAARHAVHSSARAVPGSGGPGHRTPQGLAGRVPARDTRPVAHHDAADGLAGCAVFDKG
ncbi:Dbl homology domain-containing protein [Linderina pennispora]|uniref:Dbl homology domain-containing protein n=1 Tax=Linderina pennispora TaxID=61395 RepID=A0A1Y1W036_9FUNG|nr:Dbl homology domain-containing protein [Linderina pennispora]ORX66878.1 Dbl homology domain-containing protein [Linderina pennispora]